MRESPDTDLPAWRSAPQASGDGRTFTRRLGAVLLGAALLALCGAVIAWLLYLRPFQPPHFLPLCISEYGEEFPIRSWTRQDADLLRGLGWVEKNAFTTQKRDLLVQQLREFTQEKSAGPLVVYLSAYAIESTRGELHILPVDAHLDRPDTWLPLREVLDRLRDSPVPHKLLLLDVMQPFTDLRRGVLLNDVAESVQRLLDDLLPKDPNLSVLCACSPGEHSVVAEELGHSVFAYFVWRGLRGEADREHASDGRIFLQELAEYVTAQVEQWTRQHRQVSQLPRLHGARGDYPLAAVAATEPPEPETPLETVYPEWLSDSWKLRDRWFDEEVYRIDPALFRQLEIAVLRAEQQWRGGVGSERVRRELTARRERFESQRRQRVPAASAMPPSSPAPLDAETIVQVGQLATRFVRASTGKPDEAELKKLETDAEAFLKKFEDKPLMLAGIVFAAAEGTAATPKGLGYLSGLLEKANAPACTETRFLNRLAPLLAAKPGDWPEESVRLALRTVREAEISAAGDPRALRWVSEARAAAVRLQQKGEALLFSQEPERRRGAATTLRAALKAYQAISRDLRTVAEAQRLRDELAVRLPSFLPYLEIDRTLEGPWRNATAATCELGRILSAPAVPAEPKRGDRIRKMGELTASLQGDPNSLNRLRRPLNRASMEKLHPPVTRGDLADWEVLTAILETPWPRAEERVRLWQTRRDLMELLLQRRTETSIAPRVERLSSAAEYRNALRRARCSLALLELDGASSVDKVEKALEQVAAAPPDATRMRHLAEELRRAWRRRGETFSGTGFPLPLADSGM
jgi:hypothetical protein